MGKSKMNTNSLSTNKQIREEMRKKRLLFFKQQKKYSELSTKCQALLLESELWKQSEHIALYRPFRGEVDTALLIKEGYSMGKALYFPRCLSFVECGEYGKMEFVSIKEEHFDTSFQEGYFGIMEPKNACLSCTLPAKTLVVLPCLAYNSDGYRLGYGGGFYDRFLSKHDCTPLSLVFKFQQNEAIEVKSWDIPLNYIVNEEEMLCYNS